MNEIKISNEEFDRVKYSRLPTNPSARTKYGDSEYRGESLKKRMDEPFELFKAKFNALVSLIGGNEQGDNLLKHIPTGITDTHTLSDLIADIVSESAEFAGYLSVGERTLLEEIERRSGTSKGAEVFNDYENNIASGEYSHVEGKDTIANGEAQHVQGKYNVEDTNNEYAHIVGGGNSDSDRKNIHTVDWQGNAWYKGTIKAGEAVEDDDLVNKKYVDGKKTAFVVTLTSPSGYLEDAILSLETYRQIYEKASEGNPCVIKTNNDYRENFYTVVSATQAQKGVEESTFVLCCGIKHPDILTRYIIQPNPVGCNISYNYYSTGKDIERVEAIAKGRSTGYVFDNEDRMYQWLSFEYKYVHKNNKSPDFSNNGQCLQDFEMDQLQVELVTLVLGDNLYIRDTSVPDYWWDGSSAQELETQKVDLDSYADKEYVEGLIGNVESVLDDILAIQNTLIGGDA
jgi:hypothetical protein